MDIDAVAKLAQGIKGLSALTVLKLEFLCTGAFAAGHPPEHLDALGPALAGLAELTTLCLSFSEFSGIHIESVDELARGISSLSKLSTFEFHGAPGFKSKLQRYLPPTCTSFVCV